MKNIILLFSMILGFCCCTNSEKKQGTNNQFIITANVTGPPDSMVIQLLDLEKREIIDSAYIINHKFKFTGSVEYPTPCEVRNKPILNTRRYGDLIWVENSNITLEGDINSPIITGSATNDKKMNYMN